MKINAPMSGAPTREIELLMADPSPDRVVGTEFMSGLVSGATMSAIPSPNRRTAGSTSMSTSDGGMSVAGRLRVASHAAESVGSRTYHNSPVAMMSGPATRNPRDPIRPANVPTRVESSVSMMPAGSPMAPAAVAV